MNHSLQIKSDQNRITMRTHALLLAMSRSSRHPILLGLGMWSHRIRTDNIFNLNQVRVTQVMESRIRICLAIREYSRRIITENLFNQDQVRLTKVMKHRLRMCIFLRASELYGERFHSIKAEHTVLLRPLKLHLNRYPGYVNL